MRKNWALGISTIALLAGCGVPLSNPTSPNPGTSLSAASEDLTAPNIAIKVLDAKRQVSKGYYETYPRQTVGFHAPIDPLATSQVTTWTATGGKLAMNSTDLDYMNYWTAPTTAGTYYVYGEITRTFHGETKVYHDVDVILVIPLKHS